MIPRNMLIILVSFQREYIFAGQVPLIPLPNRCWDPVGSQLGFSYLVLHQYMILLCFSSSELGLSFQILWMREFETFMTKSLMTKNRMDKIFFFALVEIFCLLTTSVKTNRLGYSFRSVF